jgi:hypothetical protein
MTDTQTISDQASPDPATQNDQQGPESQNTQSQPSKTATKMSEKKAVKKTGKKSAARKKTAAKSKKSAPRANTAMQVKFPRHTLQKTLRIPRAILDQNAGRDCTDKEAMEFLGITLNGDRKSEIGSAIKYGILDRPSPGRLQVTELARRILRPQQVGEDLLAKREAVLQAPDISEVYHHYRGENLPDPTFFDNALVDTFRIPAEYLSQFKNIFIDVLKDAGLVEPNGDKWRVLDVSNASGQAAVAQAESFKKLERSVSVSASDTCFVIMPFAAPLGTYYELVYQPAIEHAGLTPIRADNDIFATGKIMDQVWRGLTQAKVLVAELTSRNPNVFYELGLAHALKKPVVLISSNEEDVPFDVRHIRVIYYDINDPFWGQKLMKKVSENILSALKNPEEAIFRGPDEL